MNIQKSFYIALTLGVFSILIWEFYWRSKDRVPNLDDNKELWAQQFKKIEKPKENQIVFISSSRILFDVQRTVWEEKTGSEMVMLGVQGGSPLPVLKYIVEETKFRGLLVVGVAPDVFFWATEGDGFSWIRPKKLLDYYEDRTYAQMLNHKLSVPLQTTFAFYRDGDEEWSDDVDLKTLLKNMRTGERGGKLQSPFNNFETVQLNRNVEMSEKATHDTILANSVIRAWGLDQWEKEVDDAKEYEKTLKDIEEKRRKILNYFITYTEEYLKQGGKMVLVRCPSNGKYRELEARDFPRKQFWDSLVIKTKLPSIHFEDYPQLTGLHLPELSHLSKDDANFFTEELIKILREKKVLTTSNNN